MTVENQNIFRLGIDIGGTNTELGLVDSAGNIIARDRFPTCSCNDIETFIRNLKDRFQNLKEHMPENGVVISAGIGAPCANPSTGCIEGATDLPWKGVIPLARLCSEAFGIPVSISNDANAAAAGERMYGAAKGMKNFLMITLGTGVGGAVVCDGNLLSGSRGFAGELGHITLGEGYDRECSCGRRGCLQTYCQSKGIVRTFYENLKIQETTRLKDDSGYVMTPEKIARAAREGDSIALQTFRYTGEILGKAVANFLAFTDPEAVILFGGIANAGEILTEPMKDAMERNALFLYKNRVKILKSSLKGADAAILGASALV